MKNQIKTGSAECINVMEKGEKENAQIARSWQPRGMMILHV